MPKITYDDAVSIANKFRAEYKSGGKHKLAIIYFEGKKITQFGIRHDKTAGHDYISNQIYMSKMDCVEFGRCNISLEDWIAKMREKGIIPPEPKPAPTPEKRPIRKRHS